MNRQPFLKKIMVSMSGECSACGDLLLAQPNDMKDDKVDEAMKALREVFENHLTRKHQVLDTSGGTSNL